MNNSTFCLQNLILSLEWAQHLHNLSDNPHAFLFVLDAKGPTRAAGREPPPEELHRQRPSQHHGEVPGAIRS